MKAIGVCIFICICSNLGAQTLESVRQEFHKAVLSEEYSRPFNHFANSIPNPSSTTKAYQAVSEAMLARVVWNPFTKLALVNKYQKKIEAAVAESPNNIRHYHEWFIIVLRETLKLCNPTAILNT